jgi:hypothetical protein
MLGEGAEENHENSILKSDVSAENSYREPPDNPVHFAIIRNITFNTIVVIIIISSFAVITNLIEPCSYMSIM